MTDLIQCGNCQRKLRVRPELLGKYIRCPGCHTKFLAQPISGGGPTDTGGHIEEALADAPHSQTGLSTAQTTITPQRPEDRAAPTPAAVAEPPLSAVFLVLGGVLVATLLIGLLIALRVSAVVSDAATKRAGSLWTAPVRSATSPQRALAFDGAPSAAARLPCLSASPASPASPLSPVCSCWRSWPQTL